MPGLIPVEYCGGMDVMNEGKETSDNFCVDKLEKEDEVGSCPTRYCNDTSHSLGNQLRTMLFSIPDSGDLTVAFYRFSFQKRGHAYYC
jgi:hypothetical protein